mmetsp:Transcript_41861/g.80016  ORF Transcript_41861/g.80016 Transcript_41861/m.80016 type:complete len:828 (-) Transcript_41861:185-2668(-)
MTRATSPGESRRLSSSSDEGGASEAGGNDQSESSARSTRSPGPPADDHHHNHLPAQHDAASAAQAMPPRAAPGVASGSRAESNISATRGDGGSSRGTLSLSSSRGSSRDAASPQPAGEASNAEIRQQQAQQKQQKQQLQQQQQQQQQDNPGSGAQIAATAAHLSSLSSSGASQSASGSSRASTGPSLTRLPSLVSLVEASSQCIDQDLSSSETHTTKSTSDSSTNSTSDSSTNSTSNSSTKSATVYLDNNVTPDDCDNNQGVDCALHVPGASEPPALVDSPSPQAAPPSKQLVSGRETDVVGASGAARGAGCIDPASLLNSNSTNLNTSKTVNRTVNERGSKSNSNSNCSNENHTDNNIEGPELDGSRDFAFPGVVSGCSPDPTPQFGPLFGGVASAALSCAPGASEPVGVNETPRVGSSQTLESAGGKVEDLGYNSADEYEADDQLWSCVRGGAAPSFPGPARTHRRTPQGPSWRDDPWLESKFETDLAREHGFKIRRMLEDGNCLFRAVSDQVYGDPELHASTRQMCVDYLEAERDHFSQFVTEGFSEYLDRKRRDRCHGNNLEMQAMAEMFNRPVEVYCYSIQPINIFHSGYSTDSPAIRLSYHRGSHYNSVVDTRRSAVGAGLGLPGFKLGQMDAASKVRDAMGAREEATLEHALLLEAQMASDAAETQAAIEREVMKASRRDALRRVCASAGPSCSVYDCDQTHSAVAHSSGAAEGLSMRDATGSSKGKKKFFGKEKCSSSAGTMENRADLDLQGPSANMRTLLGMGFRYDLIQEAQCIFNDELDNMLCWLVEGLHVDGEHSSMVDERGKGKHVASSWEDGP